MLVYPLARAPDVFPWYHFEDAVSHSSNSSTSTVENSTAGQYETFGSTTANGATAEDGHFNNYDADGVYSTLGLGESSNLFQSSNDEASSVTINEAHASGISTTTNFFGSTITYFQDGQTNAISSYAGGFVSDSVTGWNSYSFSSNNFGATNFVAGSAFSSHDQYFIVNAGSTLVGVSNQTNDYNETQNSNSYSSSTGYTSGYTDMDATGGVTQYNESYSYVENSHHYDKFAIEIGHVTDTGTGTQISHSTTVQSDTWGSDGGEVSSNYTTFSGGSVNKISFYTTMESTEVINGLTLTQSTKSTVITIGSYASQVPTTATTSIVVSVNDYVTNTQVSYAVTVMQTYEDTDATSSFFDGTSTSTRHPSNTWSTWAGDKSIYDTVLLPQVDGVLDDWLWLFSAGQGAAGFGEDLSEFTQIFASVGPMTISGAYGGVLVATPEIDVSPYEDINSANSSSFTYVGNNVYVSSVTGTTDAQTVSEATAVTIVMGSDDTALPLLGTTRTFPYGELSNTTIEFTSRGIASTTVTFFGPATQTFIDIGDPQTTTVDPSPRISTWINSDGGISSTRFPTLQDVTQEGEQTFIGAIPAMIQWHSTSSDGAGYSEGGSFAHEQYQKVTFMDVGYQGSDASEMWTFLPAYKYDPGFQIQPSIDAPNLVFQGINANQSMPFPANFYAGVCAGLSPKRASCPFNVSLTGSLINTDNVTWRYSWDFEPTGLDTNVGPEISVTSVFSILQGSTTSHVSNSFVNFLAGLGGEAGTVAIGHKAGVFNNPYSVYHFGGPPALSNKAQTVLIYGGYRTSSPEGHPGTTFWDEDDGNTSFEAATDRLVPLEPLQLIRITNVRNQGTAGAHAYLAVVLNQHEDSVTWHP